MSTRLPNGTFAKGNAGGPGRPRRAKERDYLQALTDVVGLEDWRAIVQKAVDTAKAGDHRAREWLAKYLVGDDPLAVLDLAEELEALTVALEEMKHGRGNHRPPAQRGGASEDGDSGAGTGPAAGPDPQPEGDALG
jgi:hypothetical protein